LFAKIRKKMETQTLEGFKYSSYKHPKPETNKKYLRVYGNRLCPFVQRAVLALTAKEIEFQYVQVELREKAQWHKDINGGLVPIMETPDGDLIPESSIIAHFAMEFGRGKGMKLWPSEGSESDTAAVILSAKHRREILVFDKLLNKLWNPLLSLYTNKEATLALKADLPKWEAFVDRNTTTGYLSGQENPMYIDIHCFPMMERLVMLENSPIHSAFELLDIKNQCPKMYKYVHHIREHAILKKHAIRQHENNKHLAYWLENIDKGKAQLSIDFLDD